MTDEVLWQKISEISGKGKREIDQESNRSCSCRQFRRSQAHEYVVF